MKPGHRHFPLFTQPGIICTQRSLIRILHYGIVDGLEHLGADIHF